MKPMTIQSVPLRMACLEKTYDPVPGAAFPATVFFNGQVNETGLARSNSIGIAGKRPC